MKLYHYTTWPGPTIYRQGYVSPSNKFMAYRGTPLVFLTTEEYWDSSVQAMSIDRYYEKCGSCPEVYAELGIPCWKFQVDVFVDQTFPPHTAHSWYWQEMLTDAWKLDSDPRLWRISKIKTKVKKSWLWEGEWNEKFREV